MNTGLGVEKCVLTRVMVAHGRILGVCLWYVIEVSSAQVTRGNAVAVVEGLAAETVIVTAELGALVSAVDVLIDGV